MKVVKYYYFNADTNEDLFKFYDYKRSTDPDLMMRKLLVITEEEITDKLLDECLLYNVKIELFIPNYTQTEFIE